jgi:hypothetical protein
MESSNHEKTVSKSFSVIKKRLKFLTCEKNFLSSFWSCFIPAIVLKSFENYEATFSAKIIDENKVAFKAEPDDNFDGLKGKDLKRTVLNKK